MIPIVYRILIQYTTANFLGFMEMDVVPWADQPLYEKMVNIFATLVMMPLIFSAIPYKYMNKVPYYLEYYFVGFNYTVWFWAVDYVLGWMEYTYWYTVKVITSDTS